MASAALKLVETLVPLAEPAPARSVLRFITCGSVDDGKSTLIGRILYECGAVFEDHLEALDRDSQRFGTNGKALDFALLVDGLAAEREQGITIDVAYRYFQTPKRHFIVADTPGHEQYTRNMATGASTADVAILLVDARKGLLPQTRRHSFIVSTMGVRQVIVAINKMDLVGYDEAVFRAIETEYRALAAALGFERITCLPVSAREGDNLSVPSENMPWFTGTPLLPLLETLDVEPRRDENPAFALPVQWVNRPNLDFRGFSGTIASGRVSVGDAIEALPSRRESRIARIVTADGDLETAFAGQAVTLVLADEIDLSRGDVIAAPLAVRASSRPRTRQEVEARVILTGEKTIEHGAQFLVKLGTAMAGATVLAIHERTNIESFDGEPAESLALNAIGRVRLACDKPLVLTDYAQSRELGGFILVDRLTNETSAFGFVLHDAAPDLKDATEIDLAIARVLGPEGSAKRQARLNLITWRVASALGVAGIVFALSGQGSIAALAGLADLTLRPIARALHDALWRKIQERREAGLSLDGGGI
ncbi:sulfate adenylyltransferase subunit 1 [Rhabdaerophilum sp.]|uniref:sulfate adenylyltransferase subunit 1 n=1 Tax=Rhabdaerophilum sp. TaxID=2717341 RepID=UPI0038D471EB